MGPVIDMVRDHAAHIHEDIEAYMKHKGKRLSGLSARILAFRDYYAGGAPAMLETQFFSLPDQSQEFQSVVSTLRAAEGGNEPEESGLEALALAIRSPWSRDQARSSRQVIVMWTDDAAHPLERAELRKPAQPYPRGRVPRSLDELTDWWNDQRYIDQAARRLILFAPKVYPWRILYDDWEETVLVESRAGAGVSDQDYTSTIRTIVESVVAKAI
jgi:hypothetical protein